MTGLNELLLDTFNRLQQALAVVEAAFDRDARDYWLIEHELCQALKHAGAEFQPLAIQRRRRAMQAHYEAECAKRNAAALALMAGGLNHYQAAEQCDASPGYVRGLDTDLADMRLAESWQRVLTGYADGKPLPECLDAELLTHDMWRYRKRVNADFKAAAQEAAGQRKAARQGVKGIAESVLRDGGSVGEAVRQSGLPRRTVRRLRDELKT